jgi:6-phosphofructokinase 1
MKRIGVLTGGGDAPGMNPALKALAYRAAEAGITTVGIYDGWEGLLGDTMPETLDLDPPVVRTWDRDGGSNLGTSRTNPFRLARDGVKVDASREVERNLTRLGLDALVVIGGEDSLGVAQRLHLRGVPVVGVPKTVSGDLGGTDYALGFDTSMRTCAEIIERSRTPAGSQGWVQVVEVMGSHAGHLALWSGLAGGAQVILIPEHPFRLDRLYALIEDRLDRPRYKGTRTPRYATVVVAEGAAPEGGHEVRVDAAPDAFGHARLGGIGALLAERLRADTGHDARAVALGHPQRGGPPSAVDKIMGLLFGTAAAEACLQGAFGQMVCSRGIAPACDIGLVPIADAIATRHLVDVARYYDTDRYFAKRRVLGLGPTPG